MKIITIAHNTFKEATRNKIFYLLIFFGVIFAGASKLLGILSVGEQTRILKDAGLSAISFFSAMIAIFTGINLIYKEIDKRTIFNILSKPVSRGTFITGKFVGLSFTLFNALWPMVVIFYVFLWLYTGEFDPKLLLYFSLLYIELLIINALSLLFSSFTTPILSTIFTISLYIIGHLTWTFNQFKHKLIEPVSKYLIYIVYYLVPNLDKFNIKNAVVLNKELSFVSLGLTVLYGALYIAGILCLTTWIFKRREFK